MNEHLFCNFQFSKGWLFCVVAHDPPKIAEAPGQEHANISMTIEKVWLSSLDDRKPIDFFRELPLIQLENTINSKEALFEIVRLSNSIARESKRGQGNIILYNNNFLPTFNFNHFNYVYYPELELGEFVILYRGQVYYDGAICSSRAEGASADVYYPNPNFEKYCRRFRFKTEEKNEII